MVCSMVYVWHKMCVCMCIVCGVAYCDMCVGVCGTWCGMCVHTRWTDRLTACLGHCEHCCTLDSVPLGVHPVVRSLNHIILFLVALNYLEITPDSVVI